MPVDEIVLKYLQQKKPLTYQDYLELPNDRNRYEIIEGKLIMSPAPITIHQRVSIKIGFQLILYVEKKKLGEVFYAPLDVILDENKVIQPDLLFISNANKNIITEENIQGMPDLIIEIISPVTAYYDLFDKKELYEKFGVKEYWIVYPKKQWIEVYVLQQEKYELFQRQEKSGTIQSKIIDDFEIPLKDIFEQEAQ